MNCLVIAQRDRILNFVLYVCVFFFFFCEKFHFFSSFMSLSHFFFTHPSCPSGVYMCKSLRLTKLVYHTQRRNVLRTQSETSSLMLLVRLYKRPKMSPFYIHTNYDSFCSHFSQTIHSPIELSLSFTASRLLFSSKCLIFSSSLSHSVSLCFRCSFQSLASFCIRFEKSRTL